MLQALPSQLWEHRLLLALRDSQIGRVVLLMSLICVRLKKAHCLVYLGDL